MALEVCYWKAIGKQDELIKNVRISKLSEIDERHLVTNRVSDCDLVTLERTDKQSPFYKELWKSTKYVDLNER